MRRWSLVFLSLIFLTSCDVQIPYTVEIYLPYLPQEQQYWCAPACVQMWANRDGRYPTQSEIAGIITGPLGSTMELTAMGVRYFTNSWNAVNIDYYGSDNGQNEALSAAVASLQFGNPAILPFDGGTHAVIVKRSEYTQGLFSGTVTALNITFHDPAWGDNCFLGASYLKNNFYQPIDGAYKVIVSTYNNYGEGLNGYAEFLNMNGNYYGGPIPYYPQ